MSTEEFAASLEARQAQRDYAAAVNDIVSASAYFNAATQAAIDVQAATEDDIRECSISNPDPRPTLCYRLMVEHTRGFVKVGDFATHEDAEASLTVELAKRIGRRYSISAVAAR